MEPERGPVVGLRERVLELVPVVELRSAGTIGSSGGSAKPPRRTSASRTCASLAATWRLVGVVLEAAAATGAEVRAGRLDAVGLGSSISSAVASAKPRFTFVDPRADEIAGKRAADEDDEAVVPGDAVAAVGERVDLELELLTFGRCSGHAASVRTRCAPSLRRTATWTERSRGPSNSQKKIPC